MHRSPLAGLKASGHLVAKTSASCLADDSLDLPYDWGGKARGIVLGICLARSTVLQDLARVFGGNVKRSEKKLSELLGNKRFELGEPCRKAAIQALRRIGKRRFFRYRGKLILIGDATSYAKPRSRGKKRRMPKIGTIPLHNLPAKEKVLAPGYNEFWTGLLLKDKTCLGITRRLFTEHTARPSRNALEESEIMRAIALVKEAFQMDVIFVADRGFRRKELLAALRKEWGVDFVIRIEGKLTVKARGWNGLLQDLAPHWPERFRRHWRDDGKDPILSGVRAAAVSVALGRARLGFNVVTLTPVNRELNPLILATSLPIGNVEELSTIVTIYSRRWAAETFFFAFKRSLGAGKFRVFSCWEALDRLLALAHIAFLVLYLAWVLSRDAADKAWAGLWERVHQRLREHFARPPELTLGYFFAALALDFHAHAPWRASP